MQMIANKIAFVFLLLSCISLRGSGYGFGKLQFQFQSRATLSMTTFSLPGYVQKTLSHNMNAVDKRVNMVSFEIVNTDDERKLEFTEDKCYVILVDLSVRDFNDLQYAGGVHSTQLIFIDQIQREDVTT